MLCSEGAPNFLGKVQREGSNFFCKSLKKCYRKFSGGWTVVPVAPPPMFKGYFEFCRLLHHPRHCVKHSGATIKSKVRPNPRLTILQACQDMGREDKQKFVSGALSLILIRPQ